MTLISTIITLIVSSKFKPQMNAVCAWLLQT